MPDQHNHKMAFSCLPYELCVRASICFALILLSLRGNWWCDCTICFRFIFGQYTNINKLDKAICIFNTIQFRILPRQNVHILHPSSAHNHFLLFYRVQLFVTITATKKNHLMLSKPIDLARICVSSTNQKISTHFCSSNWIPFQVICTHW